MSSTRSLSDRLGTYVVAWLMMVLAPPDRRDELRPVCERPLLDRLERRCVVEELFCCPLSRLLSFFDRANSCSAKLFI